jgi:hypothetical protein
VSEVKNAPLADSSWINLKKIGFFVSFFLKKRNTKEKELALKLHCHKRSREIANSNSLLNKRLELILMIISTVNLNCILIDV